MPAEQVDIRFSPVKIEYQPPAEESKDDSFHFTVESAETNVSLIAPAVQSADHRSTDSEFDPANGDDDETAYEVNLNDVMVTSYGTHGSADGARDAGLRSDGELVQAVSDADTGGDFIL